MRFEQNLVAQEQFERFRRLAEKHGVQAIDHGNGHWQLRHRMIVNYYPFAKRGPTLYVAGTSYSTTTATPEEAVQAALRPPGVVRLEERKGTSWSQSQRKRMLRKSRVCHWCGVGLSFETSTVDHVIPLVRGGTNRQDNLVLACSPCNNKRGGEMTVLG